MSTANTKITARREALKCLAFGGAGTLLVLAGGVLTPVDLAMAATQSHLKVGVPLFTPRARRPFLSLRLAIVRVPVPSK